MPWRGWPPTADGRRPWWWVSSRFPTAWSKQSPGRTRHWSRPAGPRLSASERNRLSAAVPWSCSRPAAVGIGLAAICGPSLPSSRVPAEARLSRSEPLRWAVLCCAGLGCAVLCCAVLGWAVLCCAGLCCAGLGWAGLSRAILIGRSICPPAGPGLQGEPGRASKGSRAGPPKGAGPGLQGEPGRASQGSRAGPPKGAGPGLQRRAGRPWVQRP